MSEKKTVINEGKNETRKDGANPSTNKFQGGKNDPGKDKPKDIPTQRNPEKK